MSLSQLSFEEANRLCQSVLILISRQNLQEKQRNAKIKQSPTLRAQAKLSTDSPRKGAFREPRQEMSESSTLDASGNLDKSPLKGASPMFPRVPQEKETFPGDLMKVLEETPLKLQQRGRLLSFLPNCSSTSKMHEQKLTQNMEVETPSHQSQQVACIDARLVPESLLKEVKRDLQIQSKGKICKTQQMDVQTGQLQGFHFFCKNDHECPFHFYLQYSGTQNPQGEKLYKPIGDCLDHLPGCLQNEEQLAYMRLTKLIDSMEESIRRMLSENIDLKPKDILANIAEELGETDQKFIYKGLTCKSYHKAVKKYFDNLIYKVKAPMMGRP